MEDRFLVCNTADSTLSRECSPYDKLNGSNEKGFISRWKGNERTKERHKRGPGYIHVWTRCPLTSLPQGLQVFLQKQWSWQQHAGRPTTAVKLLTSEMTAAAGTIGTLFYYRKTYTVKNWFARFPSPAGMSLTKLSQDGNYLVLNCWGKYFW